MRYKFKRLLFEIKRYLKHPLCLIKHKISPNEISTNGKYLDYHCARCQKVIKRVSVKGSLSFLRLKKLCEEEGMELPNALP